MTPESIFTAALEKGPAQRAAFLDAACGGDEALRQAVERLLAAHDSKGLLDRTAVGAEDRFDSITASSPPYRPLDRPAAGAGGRPTVPQVAKEDTRVGPYILVQFLGEGGMGSVWVAEQTEPVKRKVPLKLIKAGMDSSSVVARFEHERQALAMMDHPNIARVFDGGMTPDGRPFFVMELVNGMPLCKFCDEAKLTPRQRLDLFVPICQAVQHAHQKGIVHRDLKPSNIVVTLYDGKPVPKVIDFGVAKALVGKLTDETVATSFGAAIGTLEYMAPEQAGFSALDIDTRGHLFTRRHPLRIAHRVETGQRQALACGGDCGDSPHPSGGSAWRKAENGATKALARWRATSNAFLPMSRWRPGRRRCAIEPVNF